MVSRWQKVVGGLADSKRFFPKAEIIHIFFGWGEHYVMFWAKALPCTCSAFSQGGFTHIPVPSKYVFIKWFHVPGWFFNPYYSFLVRFYFMLGYVSLP